MFHAAQSHIHAAQSHLLEAESHLLAAQQHFHAAEVALTGHRSNLYKTAASRHFVNLFLLLYSPVGEYKGMSRHIGPITTWDFLCSLV